MLPSGQSISVTSSYYTLCNGSNGACAGVNGLSGCSNSSSDQAAWVNLNGNNTLSCSCNVSSSNLPVFSCNDLVTVRDWCTDNEKNIYITDSATVPCKCENQCSQGNLLRAMDMTEATFKYFENGSTSRGFIPITIYY